jgi:hypothetical protein
VAKFGAEFIVLKPQILDGDADPEDGRTPLRRPSLLRRKVVTCSTRFAPVRSSSPRLSKKESNAGKSCLVIWCT